MLWLVSVSGAHAAGWQIKVIDSSAAAFYLTGDGKTGVFPTEKDGESVIGAYNMKTGKYSYADLDPEDCTSFAAAYNSKGFHVIGGRCQEKTTEKHLHTFIYNPQSGKIIKHPRINPNLYRDIRIHAVNSSGVALVSRAYESSIYRVEYPNGVGFDIEDYSSGCTHSPYHSMQCTHVVDISDGGIVAINSRWESWNSYTRPYLGTAKNPYKHPLTIPPDHKSSVKVLGISDNDEFAYGLYIDTEEVVKIIIWLLKHNDTLTFAPPTGYTIDFMSGIYMNSHGNAVLKIKDPDNKQFIGFFHFASESFYKLSQHTTPTGFDLRMARGIDDSNNIVVFGLPGGSWQTYLLEFVP